LRSPKSDADTLYSSLRYITTRTVQGHDGALRELLTSPRAAQHDGKIASVALDALLATSQSRTGTARFLASAATDPAHASIVLVLERGLWQLRPESVEALFGELMRPYDGSRLRAIARLLHRLTDVRPPQSVKFWQEAGPADRAKAISVWRKRFYEAQKPSAKP